MCVNDGTTQYEGQGRLDGALCAYEEKDKMDFLKRVSALLLPCALPFIIAHSLLSVALQVPRGMRVHYVCTKVLKQSGVTVVLGGTM